MTGRRASGDTRPGRGTLTEAKICPKCGKRSMIKAGTPGGKYYMVCQNCGEKRGPLKEDSLKGVV